MIFLSNNNKLRHKCLKKIINNKVQILDSNKYNKILLAN